MQQLQEPLPELGELLGGRWQLQALGASAFCDTWEARQGRELLFLKSAAETAAGMLRAEADGLRALAATETIRVPAVRAVLDRPGGGVILALEWLQLGRPDAEFGFRFGEALAALHAHAAPLEPAGFGWRSDNYVGATPQRNTPTQAPTASGWIAFFADARLAAMRERLRNAPGDLRSAIDAVIETLPGLFADGRAPRPSLIHGDLWQGNWGMLSDGTPVVFDPAVSCSDAQAELAMMELFGSPPRGFREAYEHSGGIWPDLKRTQLYQLYHLLNHAVLFGGSYLQQALRSARALVA
ncbi:fructosamine kinase family protein [Ramlibacter monticola]|jgi:fructosamine-3-kinase|uniref:Fructosamine kinase family protein n=1 Tax=Ramlibacter monticola TaxID=1926872 RepID=A0A936Z2Y2_9BURK|nr:fructosamine kinase family protein [Ramlibacter monticola]MBL0392921.1 fructosamine kinase family protein [Ramlibacter monticola]